MDSVPFFGARPFTPIPPPWQASVPLESRLHPKIGWFFAINDLTKGTLAAMDFLGVKGSPQQL